MDFPCKIRPGCIASSREKVGKPRKTFQCSFLFYYCSSIVVPIFPPPLPLLPTLPSLSLSIGPLYMFFDDPPFFPLLPPSPCPSGYCQFVLYVNILETRGKHRIDFLESQNKKEWGSLAENAVLLANACAVLLKWKNWWFPILLGRTYVPVCLGLPICMPAFLTLLKFLSSGKELRIAKTTL